MVEYRGGVLKHLKIAFKSDLKNIYEIITENSLYMASQRRTDVGVTVYDNMISLRRHVTSGLWLDSLIIVNGGCPVNCSCCCCFVDLRPR